LGREGGSVNALIRAARDRYRAWCEDDGVPYWVVWSRDYRKPLVIGGRHHRGWLLSPLLVVDLRNLTCGLYWQHHADPRTPLAS
jgi:hypothetical protein